MKTVALAAISIVISIFAAGTLATAGWVLWSYFRPTPSAPSPEHVRLEGEKVVHLVEEYRSLHGKAPKELSDIPNYNPTILYGCSISYAASEDLTIYTIIVSDRQSVLMYTSTNSGWQPAY